MPTEDELREKYSRMETPDLLEIVASKTDYTELAVLVAQKELKNRKVPIAEIENHQPPEDLYKELWMKNCLFDLSFLQKAASYFFGMFNFLAGIIVRRITFRGNVGQLYSLGFKNRGYILKANQYNYYAIAGFSFFTISLIVSQLSGSIFLIVWIAGFLISYAFDAGFNKQRQIGKLHEIIEQGELPWGY